MAGIFGRRVSALGRRPRANDGPMPFLPMDDVGLEPVAFDPGGRVGQFGAGPIERSLGDNLRGIGSVFTDVASGLNGRSPAASQAFADEMQGRQAMADWGAELDGMGLPPEIRTFAEANPGAFKEMQFNDTMAAQKKDEALGLLSGLDLAPEVMARAQMNPQGFMEELGKGAGKTQEDTYQDPLTGEWKIRPQIGQNGDSLFVHDGVNDPRFIQRPKTYDEVEGERAARAKERGADADRVISEKNADTARLNATRAPGQPGRPRAGGAVIDDPAQSIIDDGYSGGGAKEGYSGGRLIRVGIGTDGKYAPTDGDPEVPSGKRFPPPAFNLTAGLGDKAGPTINAEQKVMTGITNTRDSAVLLKSLTDKYITQSEGYPFGSMWWDTGRQMIDPKTRGLEGLNAQMALEIGKMAKGAMSDADRDWFIKAAPNAQGKPESNAVFAMRATAVANNANQYAAFMQAYRAEYGVGSLAEAQRYWDMYSVANPVFNDNGDPAKDRMTYTEFFTGDRAKRDDVFERDYPGVRGEQGGGLSKAESDELEQLRRELGSQ